MAKLRRLDDFDFGYQGGYEGLDLPNGYDNEQSGGGNAPLNPSALTVGAPNPNEGPPPPIPPKPAPYSGPRYTKYDLGRGDVRDSILNTIRPFGEDAGAIEKAMSANQDLFRGAKLTGTHKDKLDFGNGLMVDVRGGAARGLNQLQWMDPSHPVYTGDYSAHGGAPKPSAPPSLDSLIQQRSPAAATAPTSAPKQAPQAAPQTAPKSMDDIMSELSKMFPNGMFNQNLVNTRVSSANDALNRGRKSRLATNRAELAERGTLNSQDAPSMNRMDERLYDTYAGAVRDIFADESGAADQRMMQALTTAAGLSTEQARQVIDRFRAENENKFNMGNLALGGQRLGLDRELGRGNLALGNRNAGINETLGLGNLALGNVSEQNRYNLGVGNLNLNRDQLQNTINSGDTDSLIRLLELYLRGSQSTTTGAR